LFLRTPRGFFGICVGGGVFLDISNKKMYNMNRVGENVTFIEEYDVASINATKGNVICNSLKCDKVEGDITINSVE